MGLRNNFTSLSSSLVGEHGEYKSDDGMEGVSTLNGFALTGNWVLSFGRTTASTGGTICGTFSSTAGVEATNAFIPIAGADFSTAKQGAATIKVGVPAAGVFGFGATFDAAEIDVETAGVGGAVVGVKDATAGVEVGIAGVIEDFAEVGLAVVRVRATAARLGVAVVGFLGRVVVGVKEEVAETEEVAVVTERMGVGVATVREVRGRIKAAVLGEEVDLAAVGL